MYYKDFAEAFRAWDIEGGAMLYDPPGARRHGQDTSEQWSIWSGAALLEMDIDPKEATIQALRAGGMTDDAIAIEMQQWDD